MPTTEELLAQLEAEAQSETPVCVIDPETRTITVPPEYQLLGVENDKRVERLYFQCPKVVGDNQDLSQDYILFVNYVNANGDPDAYKINDMQVDGDDITFSWLLEEKVTLYRGSIQISFCGIIPGDEQEDPDKNRWGTTINTDCTVLTGLKCTQQVAESNPDALAQIWAAIDELKAGGGGSVDPEQIKQAVNGYLEENPVSGMTAEQEQQLNQNTTDIAGLKSAKVDKTGWSPNKYIGTDAFGNIVEKDAPNPNAEIAQAEGSNLTLQDCINGSPESFKVTGITVTEENKTEVAKQENFDVIVNGNHTTFDPTLYALVKEGATYADEADLIGKNINKKIRKLIFTGEEDFTYSQYYCDIYTIPDSADYHNGESMYDRLCGALCTHFKLMNYGSISPANSVYINGYFGLNDSGNSINFGYTKDGENAATVEELKEYFRGQYEAGTPVTVFYILRNEKTEFISGNDITLEEGTNVITNSYNYNMDVSYYKTKGNNIPTEDDGSIDIDSLKNYFVAKESSSDPDNEWWDDFKNFMGRNPAISPVDEQMKAPLVSNGMITAFADRWKTGQQGMSTKGILSDSTFVQGGHVFEGWDTEKEWRLTALIGKFSKGRCHIFSFKPNENGVEEFGIVTIGGDHEYDGMDFSQKYAQMWGNIIASAFSGPSNYGSQKYYGGISGTDKTKPSGAHLEITADFHSTAPKQARFNDCENGLVIPVLSSDPTVLNNGTIWYNSTDNKFKAVSNGEIIILNQ